MASLRWAVVLGVAYACCPFAVFCQGTATPVTAGFSIAGTVIERGSNRPLHHVLVTINPTEHRDVELSCVTGSDGQFRFTNLPVGKYSLAAQKSGEPAEGYRQNESYSTAIAVGRGLDSENIVFPLDFPGSISGTVLDDQGDAVPQAQILLLRKRVLSGKSQIVMREQQGTDSSGAFYMGHLAPGTYYVAAQGRPWYAQNVMPQAVQDQAFSQSAGAEPEPNRSAAELDVAYPLTYYGDSADPASASPITLTEGGSAKIQITLRAVPALHVELEGTGPQRTRYVAPMLFTSGPGGSLIPANTSWSTMGDREELTGIAPGHYVIRIQKFDQGRPEPAGTKVLDLTGNSTLDIRDLPKASLTGQVSFEGNERPSGQAAVEFFSAANFNRQDLSLPIRADGTFTTTDTNIMPGHYEVALMNAPGFYVKSISAKGAQSSGTEIDVPEGATVQVSMVAATGLTRVDGIALNNSKPVAGAMVLLVPQDLSRTAQFRRDQSDSDGTFSLLDVVPGRYTLVAISDGRDLEYENPAVINGYLSQGETLDIPLRDHSAVKVNVQDRRN